MDTINSISANVPCTQKTGIYKTNNDYFNDKSTHDNYNKNSQGSKDRTVR